MTKHFNASIALNDSTYIKAIEKINILCNNNDIITILNIYVFECLAIYLNNLLSKY